MMSQIPEWAIQFGLVCKGNYFEGYVDNLSPVLEIYQRESVTTWGTRRLSNNHEKENENVIFVYH